MDLNPLYVQIALFVGGIIVLCFQGLVTAIGVILWSMISRLRKDVNGLQALNSQMALDIEKRHPTKPELEKAVLEMALQLKDGVRDIKATMSTNHENLRTSIISLFDRKAEKVDLDALRVRVDNINPSQ